MMVGSFLWLLYRDCSRELTVFMKLKMVSWNVQGLNDSRKRLVVKNLLREWNCDVVCLQETKLVGMDRQIVCSLWSCSYVDWVALYVDQTAGGVLMMWDRWGFDDVGQVGFRKVGGYGGFLFCVGSVAGCGRWFYLGMFWGL